MENREKGFTLIELLAVIVIIGIILIFSFRGFSSYLKSSREKLKKVEEERIVDAGSVYYTEFKDSEDYKSFVNSEDNSINSCISIQSLINKGFFKGKVKFIDDNAFNVVKVKEINGVPSYELVSYLNGDPTIIEDCIGEEFIRLLDTETNIQMSSGSDEEVTLDTVINPSDNNHYTLTLTLTKRSLQTTIEHTIPLYVLIVLDASESMRGDRYENAKSAAIELSNSITNAFNESRVGLITFNNQSTLSRGFVHSALLPYNFPDLAIYTNVVAALDMSQTQLNGIENAIKYAIFLTDGFPQVENNNIWAPPTCVYFDDNCKNAIRSSATNVKNTGSNLVVVGYELNDPNYSAQDLLLYKDIASIDTTGSSCPNSDYIDSLGNKHCYYNSTSSNISSLFSSISNSIQETVNNQTISESIITAEFDKSIKIYDENGNEIEGLEIDIDFSNVSNEYNYTYSIVIDKIDTNSFICDSDKKECTCTLPLFKNYKIELFDMNSNSFKTIELDSSPIITITKKIVSYLN